MKIKLLYICKKINESATGGTRRILGTINFLKAIDNTQCSVLTESLLNIGNVEVLKSRKIIPDKMLTLSDNFNKIGTLKIIKKDYLSFLPFGFLKIVFKKFDILYCTCPAFTNVQVGYLYKIFHPKSQFIIEYRDLYSFNPQFQENLFIRLARYFEIKIIRNADKIITTTNGMKNKLNRYVDNSKISVVYNYITFSDYEKGISSEALEINSEYYNVGYIGTLSNGRHPKVILDLLKMKIENKFIMLHFAGTSNLQNDYILENSNEEYHNRIKFYGIVDRITSLRIMKSMDSLFILINPECSVKEGFGIPGKLFDYIAMSNKILTDTHTFKQLDNELHIKRIFAFEDYIQFRALKSNYLDAELIQILNSEFLSKS